MRLFRKKEDSPEHQEYLDGLITSIRRARRTEQEKAGLHSFVEEETDAYIRPPGSPAEPPPAPPDPPVSPDVEEPPAPDIEEIANLEAYLSTLEAAEASESPEDEDEEAV